MADGTGAEGGLTSPAEMRSRFKERLRGHKVQIGLRLSMTDAYAASVAGRAGFDCLVVDAEHGPDDLAQSCRSP